MSTGLYLILRWIPGHHWVRPFVSLTGRCKPSHRWMYGGLVRRDAWRVGRLGFGLIRMPKTHLTSLES